MFTMENIISKALDDIEGMDIDGGKLYGGTTIIYFPNKNIIDKMNYDSIKSREIIHGDNIDGKFFICGKDNKPLEDGSLKDKIVLIIIDSDSWNTENLNKGINSLGSLGASYVYACSNKINETDSNFLFDIENGIVSELFVTENNDRINNPNITNLE